MDMTALKALPTATLRLLKDGIKQEITSRAHREFRAGDRASFQTSRWPIRTVRVVIVQFNRKTVSAVELDDAGKRIEHKKWRVPPEMLTAL